MKLEKILQEKRLKEILLLGGFALLLLVVCYFFFIGNGAENTNVSQTFTMSETENKLCSILSEIEGVGKINAYVKEDEEGNVLGAILVFEGADSLVVRLDVLKATAQALGVNQKEILIYEMTK